MSAKIVDTATPFLKKVAKRNPYYMDKAVKSAGWWMRKEIKAGIKSGAPGGEPYDKYSKVTKSGRLEAMRGRGKIKSGKRYRAPRRYWLKKQHKPMGKLYTATRYRFYKDSHRALVGWINRSAERIGTIQEEGKKIRITPAMRRFYFAAGFALSKGKKYIEIPARPTIDPEYEENAKKIPEYIEDKIWGYMERDA